MNRPSNNLILTGIPRSGTSYLCSILDNVKNSVVINEPRSMSTKLSKTASPDALKYYYESTRSNILKGKYIENKTINGEIIQDTATIQQFESYIRKYDNKDFVLSTKNTLGYLTRLDKISLLLPDYLIYVSVRNPIDTIASWKTSFSHLRDASVATSFFIGSKNDVFLSNWQKEELKVIDKEPNVSRRRALFWAYLAKWILKNKEKLTTLDYREVVTNPDTIVKNILSNTSLANNIEFLKTPVKSEIRTRKRISLNEEDIFWIKELCLDYANELNIKV